MTQLLLPTSDAELSGHEAAVLTVLGYHRGRQRAIGLNELSVSVGLMPREVQSLICRLIIFHGALIGSASSPPAGFFLIATPEEQRQAEGVLLARIIALSRRLASLRKMSLEKLFGQLSFIKEQGP